MSEYTAEDFAKARFAVHPDPDAVDARYAARMSRDPEFPWLLDGVLGNGDEHMARDGWVPVVESGAITLDALEAAWEAAEQADECREGDVLIIRDDEDNYLVRRMEDRSYLDSTARILSRAPREPWADLGDKLAVEMPGIEDEPRIEALAKALYCEHGVRVTGGDE